MEGNPTCGYCHMLLSVHCPGNVVHSDSSKAHRHVVRCVGRHCLAPLCDCTDFVFDESKRMTVAEHLPMQEGS